MHLLVKSISIFFITLLVFIAVVTLWAKSLTANDSTITWGVTFSDSQAEYLGLNADEVYEALITDLGVKDIKLHVNWNATEPARANLVFDTLDRRVALAEKHNVDLILVIGMKTGRWPECHTPDWFYAVPEDERQAEIVRYVSTIVGRYADSDAIHHWQIENEPFLEFGTCPDWYYEQGTSLLEAEIAAVRALDPERKIIVSESGELSSWTKAAEVADIVGVTMYRSTWNAAEETFGINPYTFLTPEFYAAKAALIESTYNNPVISIELQAEPWASTGLAEASLAEQEQSMNPELFAENIAFARAVGLDAYYFWGAEWWYWMKVRHNQPEIWNQATALFAQ
jgi:hypothetical protein